MHSFTDHIQFSEAGHDYSYVDTDICAFGPEGDPENGSYIPSLYELREGFKIYMLE